jgi:hypothetical protein
MLLERYFGKDAVHSDIDMSEGGRQPQDELKPLRQTSLFDIQCKLNAAGASGKEWLCFIS